MKLNQEFYQLPLCFDTAQLATEISTFTEADWRPHPQGNIGNSALPLIALNGDPDNDDVKGIYRPTKHLKKCPYIQQILAAIPVVWGRTRLMRIDGGGEATRHFDTNYYWLQRVRVHIPIITFPEVTFLCGETSVNMAAGEAWIFDTWLQHNVINPTPYARIHLVADTVGSADFWSLVENSGKAPQFVPYSPHKSVEIITENVNFSIVMSPWEQLEIIAFIIADLSQMELNQKEDIKKLSKILTRFQQEWRSLWSRYGVSQQGELNYRQALNNLEKQAQNFKGQLFFPNYGEAVDIIQRFLIMPALNYELAVKSEKTISSPISPSRNLSSRSRPQCERPIFIVAAPRSGSTLLFETLAQSPTVWTIGGESHVIFEKIPQLNPTDQGFTSNRLTAKDATPHLIEQVKDNFLAELRDRQGNFLAPATKSVRLLEKTPKNALRIPFLNAIFPDALFIYLYRDPQENISSILEAWRSGKFVTYPQLPNWKGLPWSLLLIPDWEKLNGKDLIDIAASQWITANSTILDDLSELGSDRRCSVSYTELIENPQAVVKRLCQFAELDWDQELNQNLPLSRYTLTPPDPQKWQKHEALIQKIWPQIEPTVAKINSFISHQAKPLAPLTTHQDRPSLDLLNNMNNDSDQAPENSQSSAMRSVYTTTLADILSEMQSSLVVSTYQTGKLIIVREDQGAIETHFEFFPKPMGMALNDSRLAIGGKNQVMELRNIPAVAQKIQPRGKYDGCYLPRYTQITGNIDIHEMAWAEDELWIVNTRFSCLCTLDPNYSFVPRWRPNFITELSPDDRCHLNGLEVVDGRPKYVTALGKSNMAQGWRKNKSQGGILIDVQTNEIIAQGLSMPHSPRWYDNRLWLLESGKGSLATVDINSGKVETVIELPGFTRGLDFYGPLAFIGLSQVREQAIFSDLPLTNQLTERKSGVWVVNIHTAEIVAFLKFEDAIQEIFAVQILAGMRYPEITMEAETLIDSSYILPDEALKSVPTSLINPNER